MLDAFGLGSGRDGLALGDLVVIGRLDAVDAIRTAGRRLDGGTIVQVAADEFGASGDERGGRWRRVVSYEGADSPAAASRWRAVAPPWFPVAPVTKTTLSRWSSTLFSFCAMALFQRELLERILLGEGRWRHLSATAEPLPAVGCPTLGFSATNSAAG